MSQSTIAVVGAGPGLGFSIAQRFGREGFQVALIARRQHVLDAMVARLREQGITAAGFPADIGDEAALQAALQAAQHTLGPIDVLDFSPVPSPEGDAAAFTPLGLDSATINRLHRLIVVGAVTSVRAVLPGMQARDRGTIFLTTSGSAHHIMPVYTPVGMVMSALRSYALCLNQVLTPEDIYVCTVCIGVLIRPGDPLGDPDVLAERYYRLHQHRQIAEEKVQEQDDLNALHDRDMAERGIDWQRPELQAG